MRSSLICALGSPASQEGVGCGCKVGAGDGEGLCPNAHTGAKSRTTAKARRRMYRLLQQEKHKQPGLVAFRGNGFSIAFLICSTQLTPEFLWTLPFVPGPSAGSLSVPGSWR